MVASEAGREGATAPVAALVCALALAGCGTRRPDVVLISLDSVRADALTFRDLGAAPNLTELARDGTVFVQAVSGSSWTLPAHAELFTGTPPVLHGVQMDDVAIDPLTPTLPELLDRAGWFTAGFWTGWYLSGEYGFERGFDLYENAMTDGDLIEGAYQRAVRDGDLDAARGILARRDVAGHQDVTSPRVVERVRRTLERLDDDEPLFLFLHLFDPHYDYVPPPPWDTQFDPGYTGEMDGRDFYRNPRIFDPEASPPRRVNDRDLEHLVALYRGEIGWTDAALGEIFDALDARGRLDEALVVVTADHGDEFFEHGGRGHRHSLYDELLRVPLLIRPPSGRLPEPPPETVGAQVALADLAPTVLDLLGLDVPESMEGRSLAPALAGEPLAERPLVASLSVTSAQPGAPALLDALRTPDGKLVRHLALGPDGRLRVKELVYFDLARDPGETRPLRDASDPEVAAAVVRLDAELARLRARFEASERSPADARATRVREVFEADLGALGYGERAAAPELDRPWGLGPHPAPVDRRGRSPGGSSDD